MTGQEEKDLTLLNRLEELGADLGKPHEVDFFLYFSSEDMAKSALVEIESNNFVVSVNLIPPPWWRRLFAKPIWACCASKSMVSDRETIFETSAWFNEIAQKFSGEYDGWGTEVNK